VSAAPRLLAALSGAALLAASPRAAAEHAPIGTPVANRDLPVLSGGKQPLLAAGVLNVLVFFRAGQEHSRAGLVEMARCERDLSGRRLRFVAVAPGTSRPEALRDETVPAGIAMPVLLDTGDALHGQLGVFQHPAVALVDAGGRLAVFEPFRKVNFCEVVRAEIRHALGEISDADLARTRNPPAAEGRGAGAAQRQLKLGEALLKGGKAEQALSAADAALAKEAESKDAHCLRARALAVLGRCPEAAEAAAKGTCERPDCRP
jgi:hypothetical protein